MNNFKDKLVSRWVKDIDIDRYRLHVGSGPFSPDAPRP